MNRVADDILALLFPQRLCCHGCGCMLTPEEELLCAVCRKKLDACTLRRSQESRLFRGEQVLAAAAYHYRDMAADLTHSLKYLSNKTAAHILADGMARRFTRMNALRVAEICVAVPSHPKQVQRRGYPQAQVLCNAFVSIVGLPQALCVLKRVRHAKSQVGMGREERKKHIVGAFSLDTNVRQAVEDRCVLLIDDVLTTGATACECARMLYAGGARRVLVLTACRV